MQISIEISGGNYLFLLSESWKLDLSSGRIDRLLVYSIDSFIEFLSTDVSGLAISSILWAIWKIKIGLAETR